MIPVARVKKPRGFDAKVKKPGDAWIKSNPDAKRPPALWSAYASDLAAGFGNLCGYAAMLDPTGGTVDHYLSYKKYPELTYEWRNYRYASAVLNASKRTADDRVLDPYEVHAGWFEILLPSLQMRATDAVPAALKAKAEYTLDRLKLRDGERVIRWRQAWYDMYLAGKLTLPGLAEVAPLLAEAVRNHNVSKPNKTKGTQAR